jgi:uncharacterized membrane protein YdbT with pleckstrin-like domain
MQGRRACVTSYIDQTLGQGERIIMRGRWPMIHQVGTWLWLILLGWLLIGLYFFARDMITRNTTEWAVTSRRVVMKWGLINRNTREIDVRSIESIQLRQDVWGRIFGYGSLIVTGTGEANISFPQMADPVAFRKAIESARPERNGNGQR